MGAQLNATSPQDASASLRLPDARALSSVTRTELRPVTVLFADLVDFTPWAESAAPDEVGELLDGYAQRCMSVVARHGGVVEKFVGDAVMAVWGHGGTREDDPERAVRSGLALVAAIQRYAAELGRDDLKVRVGIVTGRARLAPDRHGDGLVAGDAVNTAQRVQSAAAAEEVWVDQATRERTESTVVYEARGAHPLKGKRSPVELSVAVATHLTGNAWSPEHQTVPLVGYQRERALLREAFHAAVDGGRGRLIVVVGEPGVGKTRLGRELELYVDSLPDLALWHWGRCLTLDAGSAYWPLVSALRTRIGATEHDEPETLRRRLEAHLDQYVPDVAERWWLSARLGVLLGIGQDAERADLFAAWSAWFGYLATGGTPCVWVIDDAHLADSALLDFVQHLVTVTAAPVITVLIARPELIEQRPQLLSTRGSTLVSVDGLGRQDMLELIDSLVDGLPENLKKSLAEQASTRPLYAVEAVRGLVDRGVVVDRDGRRVVADPAAAAGDLPATHAIESLVLSRLDLLDPQDLHLLKVASVLGESFTAPELAELTGTRVGALQPVLARLAERDLIGTATSRLSSDFGRYTFSHSIVRQVTYDTLTRRERSALHLAAAQATSRAEMGNTALSGVVVEHLRRAHELDVDSQGDQVQEDLATWLVRSAERSRSVGALAEALRSFELALELTDDATRASQIHLDAAEVALWLGRLDTTVEHAGAVRSEDLDDRALAAALLGRAHAMMGASGDGLAALAEYAEVPEAVRPLTAARLAFSWSMVNARRGEHEDLRMWAERCLVYAEEAGDIPTILQAMNALSIAAGSRGLPRVADALIQNVIDLAREHRHHRMLCIGLGNRGLALLGAGSLDQAVRHLAESVSTARAAGEAVVRAVMLTNLVNALFLVGRWDECLQLSDDDDVASSPGGLHLRVSGGTVVVAQLVRLARGETVDPELLARHAAARAEHPDESSWVAMGASVERYASGDVLAAAALAAGAARTELETAGAAEDFPVQWPVAVQWALSAHDWDLARSLIKLAEGIDIGSRPALLSAQLDRLAATTDLLDPNSLTDLDSVESRLRAGLDALARFGDVPHLARGRLVLAALLRQHRATAERLAEAERIDTLAREALDGLDAQAWLAEEWTLRGAGSS